MICGKESNNNETYCYIRIEPLLNRFYDVHSILEIQNSGSSWLESPFGIKEVFKNEHGNLQIKSRFLARIDCDSYTKKKNKVLYLYKGSFCVAGIIREWSKSPIEPKINRIQEYKMIQAQIEELKEKQRELRKM